MPSDRAPTTGAAMTSTAGSDYSCVACTRCPAGQEITLSAARMNTSLAKSSYTCAEGGDCSHWEYLEGYWVAEGHNTCGDVAKTFDDVEAAKAACASDPSCGGRS